MSLPVPAEQPDSKLSDNRDVVELHMIECRHCDWHSNGGEFTEDKAAPFTEHDEHNAKTQHHKMWRYTLTRERGELFTFGPNV